MDMEGFLSEHFVWIFGLIAVSVFVFQAVRILKKAKKIDNEGIETDAVVTRIEESYDPDNLSSSYTTYVEYTDQSGDRIESPLSLASRPEYSIGEVIRIRYIPGEYELVREVKNEQ